MTLKANVAPSTTLYICLLYTSDPIEHDPWQLTSFLTTLYDDYTRSEVQGKLKETFKKQYKLTTWVEVQTRYMTVWVISPAGIPIPTQVPYEYRIFHTCLLYTSISTSCQTMRIYAKTC